MNLSREDKGDRVLVLELNELTPALMDRFIAEGHLPEFRRLRDASVACVTDAGEDPPYLEPWIQWVTVHTGLSFADHQVFDLGDGAKLKAPRVWDMISDAGRTVWVCGSMNATVQSPSLLGSVLPDPWSPEIRPIPNATFAPFFDFIRAFVQNHDRGAPQLGLADYMRFGRFMMGHGLSPATIVGALRQLAGEARKKHGAWRRAAVLDDLLWDVFRHEYRRIDPVFSTFFLNSTAHFQHYHWRNLEPDAFSLPPEPQEQREYADAILFGYKQMDRIVGEAMALAGPDTSVILCTALSQQPLVSYDEEGGRRLFKPHDIGCLLTFSGIADKPAIVPVMAEDFRLFFADEKQAEAAQDRLLGLALGDGRSVMRSRRTGNELYAQCCIWAPPAKGEMVISSAGGNPLPFEALFHPVGDGVKSGMHHRDGILWMRVPGVPPRKVVRRISLQEIAPTLLALCDVPVTQAFARPAIDEVMPRAAAPSSRMVADQQMA
jgi:hypothetical protein